MKKLFLAIVILLAFGGGAAGAYFYFQQSAQASVGDTDEHQKVSKDDGHGSDSAHNEFFEMDPLLLPIVDEGGVTQVISLVVVIEVDSKKKQETVEHLSPRLKDAYIQDMYGILNKHAALRGGVVHVSMVKDRLKKISHKVLGDGVIEDVLLQVVQQRPM